MYEDDPQDLVFDVLGEAVFADHPLGRAIIGRAEVVAGTAGRRRCAPSTTRATCPGAIVVAAAGSVDHDELRRARRSAPGSSAPAQRCRRRSRRPTPRSARVRFLTKDTEQYHVCLGSPGIARDDDRRFALRVLDTHARRDVVVAPVPGGAREARPGLQRLQLPVAVTRARARSACTSGRGATTSAARCASSPTSSSAIREDGVSADELDRARENVKGRMVLSLESTSSRMSRLGSSVLADMPVLEVDEVIERIDAVTRDDVDALLGELFDPARFSAAGIGVDEAVFRESLAAAAEALRLRDPGRGRRRRRADGPHGLRRGRRRTRHGARRSRRPGARRRAGRGARRRRRRRRLHPPRYRARQRAGVRGGRACTSSSGRRASTSSRCARRRAPTCSSRRTSRSARC